MNLDADGNRVVEPVRYGVFVRVRRCLGDRNIQWERFDAPIHVKRAVLAQLEQAVADVRELVLAK
jgi:hypothetical protein